MLMKTHEVTIIGGGIIGICSALSLQDRGIRVRLIDKDDPGQATSFGNAGVISPWSIIPHSIPGFGKVFKVDVNRLAPIISLFGVLASYGSVGTKIFI